MQPDPDRREDHEPSARPSDPRPSWFDRRRAKIIAEIEANRRGEYTVPTWVLVVALIAMIVAICGFLLLV